MKRANMKMLSCLVTESLNIGKWQKKEKKKKIYRNSETLLQEVLGPFVILFWALKEDVCLLSQLTYSALVFRFRETKYITVSWFELLCSESISKMCRPNWGQSLFCFFVFLIS